MVVLYIFAITGRLLAGMMYAVSWSYDHSTDNYTCTV